MPNEAESTDQLVEQAWETPSHSEIVELTKAHVDAMDQMDDDIVWVQAGMHHVQITTVGRKSGKEHRVALPTWNDRAGHRIVVASFAGAEKHPSWFLNLRDREPGAMIRCKVQSGAFLSAAEVLEGEERDQVWEQLCADRAWYRDYQAKTDRKIPLVRLPETEAID